MVLVLVARRAGQAIVLMWIVSMAAFAASGLAPGQFTDDLRMNPQISADTVSALRGRYALDRPLLIRYVAWLRATAGGDFGFSFTYNIPVAQLFWPRALNTVLLSTFATLAAWILAVPLGIASAMRRGSHIDRALMAMSALPLACSDLLIALATLWIGARTSAFPPGGMPSIGFEQLSAVEQWRDIRWHLVLPCSALTVILLPPLYRHVRAAVADAMRSPHVQAARVHGLSPFTLARAYVLPLAANAQISMLGLSIAGLLGASLVVEVVMGWPGVGPLLLEATSARDHYVVLGIVIASAALVWIANLISDLLMYAV